MGKTAHRLGKVQFQIMEVLWERGRATAREITDALNRTQSVAHSTVQTLLRELEAKGTITHDVEERTFVFRPLFDQSEVTARATRASSPTSSTARPTASSRTCFATSGCPRKTWSASSNSSPTRRRAPTSRTATSTSSGPGTCQRVR